MHKNRSLHFSLIIILVALSGCTLGAPAQPFPFPTFDPTATPPASPPILSASTPMPTVTASPSVAPTLTPTTSATQQPQAENSGVVVYFFVIPTGFFYSNTFTLTADSTYSVEVPINEGAGFITLISYQPISVNLQSPDGTLITPISAASESSIQYGQTDVPASGVYWAQYRFINQPAGTYTLTVNSQLAGEVAVLASKLDFVVNASNSSYIHYASGQKVVLKAGLVDRTMEGAEHDLMSPDLVMTGTLFLPNGTTQAIDFNDKGLADDTTANDGQFTASVIAPDLIYTATVSSPSIRYAVYAHAGHWSHEAENSFEVIPDTARILKATGEFVVDSDADGLIDSLGITVSVQVSYTGEYFLSGELVSLDNGFQARANTPYGLTLDPGTHAVPLIFDGLSIRQNNKSGPFHLDFVELQDNTRSGIRLQTRNNLYTTRAYPVTQFERPSLEIITATERLIDEDGNGLAEALEISVQPKWSTAGNYLISGRLTGVNGGDSAFTSASPQLKADQPFTLTYSAGDLIREFVNGPYVLTELIVSRLINHSLPAGDELPTAFFSTVYVTKPYSITQFQPPDSIYHGSACAPINRSSWTISAFTNTTNLALITDGLTPTVWNSGISQNPAQAITVDLGSAQFVDGIRLNSVAEPYLYLRTVSVSVSADGVKYVPALSHEIFEVDDYVQFPLQLVRFVRLQPAETNPASWVIGELDVCQQPSPSALVVNGALVTFSITQPGQMANYTFAATAGQQLTLSLSAERGNGLYATLVGPDNQVLTEGGVYPFGLPAIEQTGTYTVSLAPYENITDTFTMALTQPLTK